MNMHERPAMTIDETIRRRRSVRGFLPDEVPDAGTGADDIQRITDWIAGMTDRFCIAAFKRIALPEESRL